MKSQAGFTLAEVLVAMLILSMGIVTIVSLQSVNTQKAVKAAQLTTATMVARSIMVDAYLKFYRKKFGSGGKESKSGTAVAGGITFKWMYTLKDVPFQMPEEFQEEDEEGQPKESDEEENPLLIPILKSINKYFKKAMRELSVEVMWDGLKPEEKIF